MLPVASLLVPLSSLLPRVPVPLSRPFGQVVLVTGASSGIGRACALLAAERGHHVVLVARRAEVLDEVAEECRDAGAASALTEVADVAEDADVAAMVERVCREHEQIDAVLHCAGVVSYGRTQDTSADDFADVVTTNLLGAASVARHVVPVLRRQGEGDLVLVGSLLGHIAVPEMTPYVVSKWGVRALARQLKIENGDMPGVRITHVAPGSVDTPIYDKALDDAGAVNSPPPPAISPERVARVVLGQLGRGGGEVQTAYSNYGVMAAFRFAPAVYDRLIGPVFQLASRQREA